MRIKHLCPGLLVCASLAIGCNGNAAGDPPGSDEPTDPGEPSLTDPSKGATYIGAPDGSVDCRVRLAQGDATLDPVSLSNDDRTVSVGGFVASARASAGHPSGKWYFEAHVDQLQADPPWIQNVGAGSLDVISTLQTSRLGAFYNRDGMLLSTGKDFTPADTFAAGDTIGVAVDVDQGKVYFRKNGAWQGGAMPEVGLGGMPIVNEPGRPAYYAAIGLASGDQWTVNFGEAPFDLAPPQGFFPYADGLNADANGDCVDPGPNGIAAPPAPMTAECVEAGFTSHGVSSAGTELRIVGVYEPASGEIDVTVHRTSPMVLVLSSYEPALWNVSAAAGAQIQKIVLSGFHASTVSAPAGIPVEERFFEEGGASFDIGHTWPADTGGGDTTDMVAAAEQATGLTMTSFGGRYRAESFTIDAD